MGSATPTPHLRADRIVGGDGPDVGGPSLSPRKQARWEAVHRLYDQGLSITAIAEQVHCDRATVRKDLAADHPRRPAVPARTPSPGTTNSSGNFGTNVWANLTKSGISLASAARHQAARVASPHRCATKVWKCRVKVQALRYRGSSAKRRLRALVARRGKWCHPVPRKCAHCRPVHGLMGRTGRATAPLAPIGRRPRLTVPRRWRSQRDTVCIDFVYPF